MKIDQTYNNQTKQTTSAPTATNRSNNSFQNQLNLTMQGDEKSQLQQMVEDIDSLLRTGLTPSELERLKELLAELKKSAKENENNPEALKEISAGLDMIEKAIFELKKRLKGVAVSKSSKEENTQDDNSSTSSLEKRIKRIEKSISELETSSKIDGENSYLLNQLLQSNRNNDRTYMQTNNQNDTKKDDLYTQAKLDKLVEQGILEKTDTMPENGWGTPEGRMKAILGNSEAIKNDPQLEKKLLDHFEKMSHEEFILLFTNQLIDIVSAVDSGIDQFDYKGPKVTQFHTKDGILSYFNEKLKSIEDHPESEVLKQSIIELINVFNSEKKDDKLNK